MLSAQELASRWKALEKQIKANKLDWVFERPADDLRSAAGWPEATYYEIGHLLSPSVPTRMLLDVKNHVPYLSPQSAEHVLTWLSRQVTIATSFANANGAPPFTTGASASDVRQWLASHQLGHLSNRTFPNHTLSLPQMIETAPSLVSWARDILLETAFIAEEGKQFLSSLVPPTEPLIRALWDTILTRWQTVALEHWPTLPTPARIETELDPVTFTIQLAWSRWCRGMPLFVMHTQPHFQVVRRCLAHPTGPCPAEVPALGVLLRHLGGLSAVEQDQLKHALATPGWERLLLHIDTVLKPRPELKVSWRVDLERHRLQALLQEDRPRGIKWRITSQQHLVENRDFLSKQDRLVLDALQRDPNEDYSSNPEPLFWRALPCLVKHPHVLVGPDPAQVTHVELGLGWSQDDQGTITVTPTICGEERSPGDVLESPGAGTTRIDYVPGELRIFELSDTNKKILTLLLRYGGVLPPQALSALLGRLPALMERMPVVLDDRLKGQQVEADVRPLVRLSVAAEGRLTIQIRVRPLAGGLAFVPGEGPAEVYTYGPSGVVWATRAIEAEPALVHATIGDLIAGEFDKEIPELDDALDFIGAVARLGDALQVEWDSKVRRVLPVSTGSGKLRVQVRSIGTWFGVGGELSIDAHTVPLSALLEAVRAGRRYVPAEDGAFVQLDSLLRERLAVVAASTSQDKRALQVPRFALPALLGLNDATVEAPRTLLKMVERMRTPVEAEVPTSLHGVLRDYQAAGFRWLARLAGWGGGGVLADDMGLGKTVQTIALLLHRREDGPALVVTPTSVSFNWVREIERFGKPLQPILYRGMDRSFGTPRAGDVVITSYDLLFRDIDTIKEHAFATLILDEAQAIKNPETQRAKAVRQVQADVRFALTGTPMENQLSELWSILDAVVPGLLGGLAQFRERFISPIERNNDPAARSLLARLVRPFILRRHKTEVAKELPARTEITDVVRMSPEQLDAYQTWRRAALAELANQSDMPPQQRRFQVLAALTRLRQLACHPRLVDPQSHAGSAKMERLIELLTEIRAEGNRTLIFSQFTTHLALVRELLDAQGVPYRYLDGSTPEVQRRQEIDAFQHGEGDVFLLSLKAGGTGLNLTAASYVIHLDPWWNPAVEDQATDRAHRIGQERPVTVYRLVSAETVEESILSLHKEKRDLVSSVLEGADGGGALSVDELVALMNA